MPINTPNKQPIIVGLIIWRNSAFVNFMLVTSNFSISCFRSPPSIWYNTSARAAVPIMTAKKDTPPIRSGESKVNLSNPVIGSCPTTASNNPIIPEINALKTDPSDKLEMTANPNTATEKYSGALNFRANSASGGATSMSTTVPKRPATTDAMQAMEIALPAIPFLAIGYPSNVVLTAEGVPGVARRIAGIAPPNMAPT